MNSTKIFHKNFLILIAGQIISLLGNSLQRFALSLYILDITGSAAIFSIILSICILPQIILAPFGGAIADRFNKKKILIILDLASALVLILFLLISNYKSPMLILIGILMCLLATIQSIYEPSVRACIPAIVSTSNLTAANSVVSEISAITTLLGPIAAGFLYGSFGIDIIFILNIISFLCSAGIECFLILPNGTKGLENNAFLTFVNDIKESMSYMIHKQRLIFYMVLLSSAFNLFLTPIYTVGIPYIEKILFGVSDELYGISEGCIGLGMITGALLVNILAKKFPLSKIHYYFVVLVLLIVGMGFTTLPFLHHTGSVPYMAYIIFTMISFLFAACLANINIIFMTFLQVETPPSMMGKIMALVASLATAFMPIGQIIFGALYEYLSANAYIIYVIVAIISLAATYFIHHLVNSNLFISSKTKELLSTNN
ncbi:MFS transporter [Anaeromicropila herbilytica]|uniref:MFS transporter n=1 Tax=Anaeromicropila herbilytica TaxID=2785025 RepID=A0A7R7EIK3_9FIRM|nr:MFS transporter [Anaeromicropila herbilytica]BCN29341.1 MFS transporter [Anaeromicropila herbilytica]